MSKQIFLPESLYGVDSEMTYEKLAVFYKNSSTITGKVLRLDSENRVFEVDIGGQLIGILPFADATIYPLHKLDGNLSPNIYDLVGKTIQVKIVSLSLNNILLSRKANMLEALEFIKNQHYVKFAIITGLSKFSAFFDIGAGITGRSYGKSFSPVKYNDIKETGAKKGDIMAVKVIEFLEDTNNFELSRIDVLPDVNDCFKENDVIVCKVFDPVGDVDGIGYFVNIDNNFSGIVDSSKKLNYGDNIVAVINKITNTGSIRLDFVKKL